MALLAACAGEKSPDDEPGFEDTSFKGFPFLEAAAARCDENTGELVITARTRGWHEYALAHLYVPSSRISADIDLDSIFARQDEWCDQMRGSVALSALGVASCGQLNLDEATIFLLVNFEEGCAGCALTDISNEQAVLDNVDAVHVPQCEPETCIYDEVSVELHKEVDDCSNMPPRRE